MNTNTQKNDNIIKRISIDMQFEPFVLDMDFEESYLSTIMGRIFLYNEHENEGIESISESEEIIGAFRLIYINANAAINHNMPLFDIYDCNGEAFEFYQDAVNPEDDEFNNNIIEILNGPPVFSQNVLLIDRIGVCPEYRGNHIGQVTIKFLIEQHSMGASIIAIKPAPFKFQHEHIKDTWVDWHNDIDVENTDVTGLVNYYQKIGFKKLANSNFLVLNTENVLPDL